MKADQQILSEIEALLAERNNIEEATAKLTDRISTLQDNYLHVVRAVRDGHTLATQDTRTLRMVPGKINSLTLQRDTVQARINTITDRLDLLRQQMDVNRMKGKKAEDKAAADQRRYDYFKAAGLIRY